MVERASGSVNEIKHNLDALACRMVQVQTESMQQAQLREATYQEHYEIASAILRMERKLDRIDQDLQALWRRIQGIERRLDHGNEPTLFSP